MGKGNRRPTNTTPPPPSGQANQGPRRATLERMEMAERELVEIKGMNKPLAKQRLEEGMNHFFGEMGRHQPGPHYNKDEYRFAAIMAHRYATSLAPYQSPTFRAVYFTPEVINQAEVNEHDARERMRQVIATIAPEIVEDDANSYDEPELVVSTNGGGKNGR